MKRDFLTSKLAVLNFCSQKRVNKNAFSVSDLSFCIKKVACMFLISYCLRGNRLSSQLENWSVSVNTNDNAHHCLEWQDVVPHQGDNGLGELPESSTPEGSPLPSVSAGKIFFSIRDSCFKRKNGYEKAKRLWRTTVWETRVVLMSQRG